MRYPLSLLLMIPSICFGTILFESNFECGRTYTATSLKPGAKRIELLPCEDLNHWPLTSGSGVIEYNLPQASDVFQYTSREGHILQGVKGLRKPHAKWVDIRTGGFDEWNGRRNRGPKEAPEKIILHSGNPISGAYSIAVRCDTPITSRLVHSIPHPDSQGIYIRFMARFSRELLGKEALAVSFLYANTQDLATPRLAPVSPGKGKPTFLVFEEPPDATMLQQHLEEKAPEIRPDSTYLIEVSFEKASSTRLVSRVWVNGQSAGKAVTDHRLFEYRTTGISLGKMGGPAANGTMWFDDFVVATGPLGPPPFQPSLIFNGNHLKCTDYQTHANDRPHAASQWQVSLTNSWILPSLNTGADPFHLMELPHPHLMVLSDSLNPWFVFREPILLPTNIESGQSCYARMRQADNRGNWSFWSRPCRFVVPPGGPKPATPEPEIKSIWLTHPKTNTQMAEIERGKWYDMHVRFAASKNRPEKAETFIDVQLTANLETAHGGCASRGEPFREASDYSFSFSWPGNRPFVRELPGSFEPSSLIGLKGLYCDPTQGNYLQDLQNGMVRVRMRLLEQAQLGPWRVLSYLKEQGNSVSPMYRTIFLVADKEKTVSARLLDRWTILLLVGFAVVLLLFVGFGRKKHGPEASDDSERPAPDPLSDDRRIAAAQQYVRDHFNEPISPRDVARAIGLSPNWLSKLFKAGTGTNLVDFITNLRIREAKRLLRETEMDIGDVSRASGFNTQVHFRRIFHRHEKMSPRAFRNSTK